MLPYVLVEMVADDSTTVYPRVISMIRTTLTGELLGHLLSKGKLAKITPRVL